MSADYRLGLMEEQTLSNGLRVIWLPDHEQPLITAEIQFMAGRFCNRQMHEGSAEIAASLIQKGPASCSGPVFSERIESGGASLFSDVGDEYISFGIRMLSRVCDELLPLFWEMVVDPGFHENEFRLIKKEMITALQAEYAEPAALANKHFFAELCGRDHPSGRFSTPRTLSAISIGTIKEFCRKEIIPSNAVFVIAGDFDVAAMRTRYETLFSEWQREAAPHQRNVPTIPFLTNTRIRCINKPDLSQTSIVVGHRGISELNPHKNALLLGNHIIGAGNFSSRLMAKIRSQTGNTYGISSQLHCNSNDGVFLIGTTTQTHQLKEVVDGIMAVYHEVMETGITDAELQKAQQFALGHLAFELEGVGNIVEKILWLRLFGRQNDYIEKYPAQIAAINTSMVNQALKQHLRSEHFVISAVGRRRDILPILQQYGTVSCFDCRAEP
jgi:zinc protease